MFPNFPRPSTAFDLLFSWPSLMRVTYPGGLLGLGGESALLLQLREEDGAEAEDGADAEAAHPADDERGEVLQRSIGAMGRAALVWLGAGIDYDAPTWFFAETSSDASSCLSPASHAMIASDSSVSASGASKGSHLFGNAKMQHATFLGFKR